MQLDLTKIRTDGGTQPRAELDVAIVSEYVDAMQRGDDFPPVKVMYDGENHWLYDGFHRVEAAQSIGRTKIGVEVGQGTKEDAQWASLAANKRHGLRRSQADKRRAIKRALKHTHGAQASDREIARHVGCDHKTVGKHREKQEATGEIPQSEERTGADGRTIDTSNIGSSQAIRTQKNTGDGSTAFPRPTPSPPKGLRGSSGAHAGNKEDEPASPDKTNRKHNIEVIGSSQSNEYYTPKRYIEAARRVMGRIDLDPATSEKANEVVGATQIFTKEDNGLQEEWRGRVWLNPPYGKGTDQTAGDFVKKLSQALEAGRVTEAIVLVNAHSAETNWFAPLWEGLICFTDHRIDFNTEQEKAGSTHGSAFSYFGPNPSLFVEEFDQFGYVTQRVHPDG